MVDTQLQGSVEETDHLDRFLRADYEMETALVDDLGREIDRRRVSLLILLALLVAFYMINHGIRLESLSDWGVGRNCVALVSLVPLGQVLKGCTGKLELVIGLRCPSRTGVISVVMIVELL